MEDLMKKLERPARSVLRAMEHPSVWGPRNVGRGNCWSCGWSLGIFRGIAQLSVTTRETEPKGLIINGPCIQELLLCVERKIS